MAGEETVSITNKVRMKNSVEVANEILCIRATIVETFAVGQNIESEFEIRKRRFSFQKLLLQESGTFCFKVLSKL